MKSNLLHIGNKLAKHGMTVTSIETLGDLLTRDGFNIVYASAYKNKFLRLSEMLIQTIRYRNKVDYVLIDTYSTKNFWYAFLISQLCRILNLKYIPKLHGGNLPNRIYRSPMFSAMIFKNSYRNIAPSSYLLEAFSHKGYAEILFIPNAIELHKYPFTARDTIAPRLLWVRSFSSIYNPEMAIGVFGEVKKEYPDAELCMVGPDKDGSLDKVRKMAEHRGLCVSFTGKLSKEEWIKISKNYDIFINTTHFDNTPVSIIEAMALGLPVVSTNVGGISYLLENGKTGILVDDNDINAMVKAIKCIVDDKELKNNLIENGFQLVQQFDWAKIKERWNEVLI